jgi:hypothetical protein
MSRASWLLPPGSHFHALSSQPTSIRKSPSSAITPTGWQYSRSHWRTHRRSAFRRGTRWYHVMVVAQGLQSSARVVRSPVSLQPTWASETASTDHERGMKWESRSLRQTPDTENLRMSTTGKSDSMDRRQIPDAPPLSGLSIRSRRTQTSKMAVGRRPFLPAATAPQAVSCRRSTGLLHEFSNLGPYGTHEE